MNGRRGQRGQGQGGGLLQRLRGGGQGQGGGLLRQRLQGGGGQGQGGGLLQRLQGGGGQGQGGGLLRQRLQGGGGQGQGGGLLGRGQRLQGALGNRAANEDPAQRQQQLEFRAKRLEELLEETHKELEALDKTPEETGSPTTSDVVDAEITEEATSEVGKKE